MSDQHYDPPGDDPDERASLLADEAAARKRAAKNLRRRQRYAEDEEFRRNMLAAHREWWAANSEEFNEQRQKRRAGDPEFRDKLNSKNRGERGRNNTLKWRYGLTLADYNAVLAKQNGVCAICKENPDGKLFVDHCHASKRVRELLCRGCNTGLGNFSERPSLLEAGAAYLRKHGRKD